MVFDAMFWGVRALAKVLLNYEDEHGLHSVRQLIDRWAPPVENDTSAYVNDVTADMKVDPDTAVNLHQLNLLMPMVKAICRHENGGDFVSEPDIAKGCSLAVT